MRWFKSSLCGLLAVALPVLAAAPAPSPAPTVAPRAPGTAPARLLALAADRGPERGTPYLLAAATGQRVDALSLRCDRVHVRAGVIACLRAQPGRGLVLELADRRGVVQASMNFLNVLLASRVRVSADGTLVAFTGFSSGHSYAGTDFSTRTYLVDVPRQRLLGDVSAFKVIESDTLRLPGRRLNVWGVSFDPATPGRFVATVGAGDQVFLARGDLAARTLTLMRADVECPSFSPDGQRVAFKRRRPGGGWWPAVLALASGREWVMKDESRSVDDQIEWLDNETLAYELPHNAGAGEGDTDVVVRAADGRGPSTVLAPHAASPSVFD